MDVDLRLLTSSSPASKEVEKQVVQPLNIVSEDAYGCCGAIRKALPKDPAMEKWTCQKCGMDWKPRLVDGMRLWEARPAFLKWK